MGLRHLFHTFILLCAAGAVLACGNEAPPPAESVGERDSAAMMTTYGVSKLISDSGMMRYKLVAEEWQMFDRTIPPRQYFPKGIFLERYDERFRVNMHITADTAWCYDQSLWELRGRVFIRDDEKQTTFATEELFWNMREHRFYSNKYMRIRLPDRELEGDRFTSDEQLTRYHISQSKGFMPMAHDDEPKAEAKGLPTDSFAEPVPLRPAPVPMRRRPMPM